MVAPRQNKSFLGDGGAGRMTIVRLLCWILFSILIVALTSLVIFLVLVWLCLILPSRNRR